MRHEIHIENWHPASVNKLLSGHWGNARRLKSGDKQMIGAYATKARIPKAEGKRRVTLIWTQYRGRTPDEDGCLKSLLDALKYLGYLKDDSPTWCELGGVTFRACAEITFTISWNEAASGVAIWCSSNRHETHAVRDGVPPVLRR